MIDFGYDPTDELPAADEATDDAVRRPDRPPEEHEPDEEPAR